MKTCKNGAFTDKKRYTKTALFYARFMQSIFTSSRQQTVTNNPFTLNPL